jgi:hypothetical protein
MKVIMMTLEVFARTISNCSDPETETVTGQILALNNK